MARAELIAALSAITAFAASPSAFSTEPWSFALQPAPIGVVAGKPETQEGDERTVGSNFTVILQDIAWRGKSIAWGFRPDGTAPASVGDFAFGAVLSGTFRIDANAQPGREVFFAELPTPVEDHIREGTETFLIEFKEAATQRAILDADGQPLAVRFAIRESPEVVQPVKGTEGDDVLIGGDGTDILDGGAGNDLLRGKGGNDFLFGGNGNDRLFGGDGDDELTPDAGEDDVDGGNGFDKVFINRVSSDLEITHNSDGSLILKDRLKLSGDKTLKAVEQIVLPDGILRAP